jgi:hypothetical protein
MSKNYEEYVAHPRDEGPWVRWKARIPWMALLALEFDHYTPFSQDSYQYVIGTGSIYYLALFRTGPVV